MSIRQQKYGVMTMWTGCIVDLPDTVEAMVKDATADLVVWNEHTAEELAPSSNKVVVTSWDHLWQPWCSTAVVVWLGSYTELYCPAGLSKLEAAKWIVRTIQEHME